MARTKRQVREARERRKIIATMRQDGSRHSREPRIKVDDPQQVVRNARTRQIGAPKGDVLHPIYGHPCGVAIDAMADDWDEARRLWAVWHDMDRAHGLYVARVIGIRRQPSAGRLDLVHDRMEAGLESPPPDCRDDDQRHRDAVNAWYLWEVRLARLDQRQREAVVGTMWGRMDAVREGRVLRAGSLMVEGVRRLREECERGR